MDTFDTPEDVVKFARSIAKMTSRSEAMLRRTAEQALKTFPALSESWVRDWVK